MFALVVAIVLVAAIGGALLARPSVLRRWYLHEISGMEIAEDPTETIVTYPLA